MPDGKAGKGRTPAQIEYDRAETARLLRRGFSTHKIAERLGRSSETTHRDAVAIRAEWAARRKHSTDEHFGRMLDALDELENEAWEAWERSKVAAERTRSESSEDDIPARGSGAKATPATTVTKRKAVVDRRHRDGDPRFLEVIMSCQERRAKLLGLDAPPRKSEEQERDEAQGYVRVRLDVLRERSPLIAKARAFLLEAGYEDAEIGEFRELLPGE